MIHDLETDLLKTEWIVYKCHNHQHYPQHLYAALCNNIFCKNESEWTCSYRNAGIIVSKLVGIEGYMDLYGSGFHANKHNCYVQEGTVTSEISNDLLNLGWMVKSH